MTEDLLDQESLGLSGTIPSELDCHVPGVVHLGHLPNPTACTHRRMNSKFSISGGEANLNIVLTSTESLMNMALFINVSWSMVPDWWSSWPR